MKNSEDRKKERKTFAVVRDTTFTTGKEKLVELEF